MKRRKLLSLLVAAAMVLSLLPMSALAAEGTEGTMTQAALEAEIAAVPAGGTVTLTGNVDVTEPIIITKELKLDLNGKTISNSGDIWNEAEYDWSLISVRAGGDLTITGSGTLQAKENDCYAVDVMDGGICTIKNGTFDGNIHAVYVREGMLVVNGGAFSVQQKYTDPSKADEFVLNCYDDHYRNGSASILVTGGRFENFNPSNCQAEGAGTSFMSADCKVAGSTSGEVTTYTVTKNQTITVDKPTEPVSNETVSATVGGVGIPTGTEGDVTANDATVTVDAIVNAAEGTTVTTANVTVGGGALTAVKGAASKLAIETNVGTLTINGGALDAITANATVGGTVTDVTLSIQNTTAQDAAATTATYELTAVDAGGDEVFSSGNASGTITVTVPAPTNQGTATGTYYIYYLGADGAELVKSMEPDADGNISWDAKHFSTYYVTATEQKVSVSDDKGNTATYDTLQKAIDNAEAGDTVKLMSNVTVDAPSGDGSGLAAITISENIILDGGGKVINIGTNFVATGGNGWDKDLGKYHVINITSDAAIQNVTIDGGWAGKDAESSNDYSAARSGINIWNNDSAKLVVTLDGVKVNNCSTYAVTARGTDLTITDMATTGSQWGVNVEDNSTVTIENSTIPEDIVYESSSDDSSLAIDGGDYGTVKVQQQDDAVTTGTVTVENATVEEVVTGGDKVSEATATISVTGSTVGTVTNTSKGTFSVAGSQITGAVPEAGDNIIMVGCTDENDSALTDVVPGNKEAMIDGTTYGTLEDALAEAQDGDVVFLLNDVTLDGNGKGNNTGIVEITKNITIEGNGKTITAESVTADADTAAGPSMITITNGANVTVRDLIIDGKGSDDSVVTDNTKHGLNIYGAGTTVTVENVTIKNGNGYAIVANGADVTIDGLITENNGWGGVNVDSKSGAANLTIEDADISESNSVKIENTAADPKPADPTVEINDGSFQYVTVGDEINKEDLGLTISGGSFATATTGAPTGALTIGDLADYLTGNLAIDGNGNVYTPSQGGSSGGSTRYAVTAPSNVSNGAVTVSPSRASYNQTVTITVTPDEGYELSSLTVTDRNGSTISLTKVSDTRYTFTMPRSAVTISASFAEEQLVSSLPFTDVSVDDWFYDMVEYVYDNGIMTGTSGTTFEPNATLTRAMMATVLWAMEGNPTSGSGSYTDVSSGDWYYNAVRWATSAGVVNGVGDNAYAPNDPLTREQMAVMLYAYAVYKGYDTAASTAAESFNDSGEISGWALTAMNWAVDNGLLGGKPGNLLDPTGSATRAEIATILRNFCENIVK